MDAKELALKRLENFVLTKRELKAARRREKTEGASMRLAAEIEKAVAARDEATRKLVDAYDFMVHMGWKS